MDNAIPFLLTASSTVPYLVAQNVLIKLIKSLTVSAPKFHLTVLDRPITIRFTIFVLKSAAVALLLMQQMETV